MVRNVPVMQSLTHRRGRGWLCVTFSVLLATVWFLGADDPSSAASTVIVSLNFDDNLANQYTLGFQQALQPAGVSATFYVNSGTVGTTGKLSWSQVNSLAAAGDEIAGKTVDGLNLTTLGTQQQISEICNDRQNIIGHGITPITFAYPSGSNNSAIQSEAQNCGYGNARTAGGLSPTGPAYAEAVPPGNWLALR